MGNLERKLPGEENWDTKRNSTARTLLQVLTSKSDVTIRTSPIGLAPDAVVVTVRSTSGDFVRWESSSEGSNCRCTSLAAKAQTTAANSIQT